IFFTSSPSPPLRFVSHRLRQTDVYSRNPWIDLAYFSAHELIPLWCVLASRTCLFVHPSLLLAITLTASQRVDVVAADKGKAGGGSSAGRRPGRVCAVVLQPE